jgi:hypothetical protein
MVNYIYKACSTIPRPPPSWSYEYSGISVRGCTALYSLGPDSTGPVPPNLDMDADKRIYAGDANPRQLS